MDVKRLYFNSLFFVYGFVLIICDNVPYIKYIYTINILIGVSYLVAFFLYKEKICFNLFFKLYLLFTIYAACSSFLSEDFFVSIKKSLTLALIFINILIIYNINSKYNNYLYLVYGVLLALCVNFLWLIGIIDLELAYKGWRFPGTVLQANNFVFILMFGLMMLIYLITIRRPSTHYIILLYCLFLILLYLVFFTASKAGLMISIALIILLLFLSLSHQNVPVFFSLIVFCYIVFYYTPLIEKLTTNSILDIEYTWINLLERIETFTSGMSSGAASTETSTGLRIKMLYDAFDMWSSSPIFGNGVAAFEIRYGHYSHNNIMELLVSFGLVGLILYYMLYAYLFFKIIKIKKTQTKTVFFIFLFFFIFFDQSIVSYADKFKILALLIIFLAIEETAMNYRVKEKK